MLEYPQVLSTLSQMLLSSISDLVLLLDYGLQWVCGAVRHRRVLTKAEIADCGGGAVQAVR